MFETIVFPIGARAVVGARFGQGTALPIYIDNTGCLGNESSLLDCDISDPGVHNCQHHEDAGVICKRRLQYSDLPL